MQQCSYAFSSSRSNNWALLQSPTSTSRKAVKPIRNPAIVNSASANHVHPVQVNVYPQYAVLCVLLLFHKHLKKNKQKTPPFSNMSAPIQTTHTNIQTTNNSSVKLNMKKYFAYVSPGSCEIYLQRPLRTQTILLQIIEYLLLQWTAS